MKTKIIEMSDWYDADCSVNVRAYVNTHGILYITHCQYLSALRRACISSGSCLCTRTPLDQEIIDVYRGNECVGYVPVRNRIG